MKFRDSLEEEIYFADREFCSKKEELWCQYCGNHDLCSHLEINEGIIADLLWAECDTEIDDWRPGPDNLSIKFGQKALKKFVQKFNLKMVCRGHEVEDGICFPFNPDNSLMTIFSASKFRLMHDNKAAAVRFNDNLEYEVFTFESLLPKLDYETALIHNVACYDANQNNSLINYIKSCEIFYTNIFFLD